MILARRLAFQDFRIHSTFELIFESTGRHFRQFLLNVFDLVLINYEYIKATQRRYLRNIFQCLEKLLLIPTSFPVFGPFSPSAEINHFSCCVTVKLITFSLLNKGSIFEVHLLIFRCLFRSVQSFFSEMVILNFKRVFSMVSFEGISIF